MTRSWQIKIGDSPIAYAGDLGIEQIDITYASQVADIATLRCSPEASWAYGTMVGIYHAGQRRFLGRVTRVQMSRTGTSSYRTVRLAGPWEWLERIPYRQSWRMWRDTDLGPVEQSRVILHQSASGDAITVEEQIADIIGHAAARGAPIAFGSAAVDLSLPWDEQRDIRCSQAIARCLRFAPDICSRIDYEESPPKIHFGGGSAVTLPQSAEALVTGYRDDLVVPGVTIEIERISTISTDDGASTFRSLQYLRAGDTDSVDSLFATLQLAGSDAARSNMYVNVLTEDIPVPLTDAAWWIARHSRLKGLSRFDVTFIQAERFVAATNAPVSDMDAARFPRISLTPLADLAAIDIHARAEVFRAIVDIVKRDNTGEIVDAEHAVELELHVIATDARTREYRAPLSRRFVSAEPTPANLAAELLAHFSVRYAEGTARWPAGDLWPSIGDTIDGTPIQSIFVTSSDKTIDVAFGPPQHLAVADFASLLQGFRTRRAAFSWRARTDGEPASDSDLTADQTGVVRASGHAPGIKRRLTIKAEKGAGGAIQLAPGWLDDDQVMRVRTISWRDSADIVRRAKILATDNIPQDGTEPPPEEEEIVPPPCGHPGNAGGGSPGSHPGDTPGGDERDIGRGDHPGNSPTPPSSGECD